MIMAEKIKVLIVDDLPTNRLLLEKTVHNSFPSEIVMADHGLDALEKLKTFTPDLVLLDVDMPQMDGPSFLKIFRSTDEWKTIPVIIVSGENDRATIREVAMLGISGYLLKPFSVNDVANRMTEALNKKAKSNTV
jgi:CheY-like chemotaxis protein